MWSLEDWSAGLMKGHAVSTGCVTHFQARESTLEKPLPDLADAHTKTPRQARQREVLGSTP